MGLTVDGLLQKKKQRQNPEKNKRRINSEQHAEDRKKRDHLKKNRGRESDLFIIKPFPDKIEKNTAERREDITAIKLTPNTVSPKRKVPKRIRYAIIGPFE